MRDNFPDARLEILGYRHIVALAEKRYYADAVRSIEYAGLAAFFARGAELPADLREYFGSFDLIVSYLFDPDGIFQTNVRRCSQAQFIIGPAKLNESEHAARQLAFPLEQFGLRLTTPGAEIFPSTEDFAAALRLLPNECDDLVAIHPGSGSATKNWPIENWKKLASKCHVLVIAGEADAIDAFREFNRVVNQPLPIVAAVLARCAQFVGHDSGISHIAAAVGSRCTLLFGPTDPAVWAPASENVRVVRPTSQRLEDVGVEQVYELMRIGMST